jgi:hypothetical protein
MCEIYEHPCKICGTPIEIHLGDYDTESSEIEVFCKDHIPKENVVIWETKAKGNRRGVQSICDKNTNAKVGIRALTENAKLNKNGNHPNAHDCEIIEER